MRVKTRFAPSPTGSLHVGSVRTALFSWLYAKHYNGEFVLRIEDTDNDRSTEESVNAILEGMHWLGLTYDAGPIYQTQRYARYQTIIAQLLNTGHAYRCHCSKERLEALRSTQLAAREKPRYDGHCRNKQLLDDKPYVIRFCNPLTGIVKFTDQIYGEICVSNQELDDFVIQRTDGHPTYNFAVVVDDWDMEITHVIRGDDHINNTPRQLNLFAAIGAKAPHYAHLPMILGDDGKRLSKRHGAVNVMQFKEDGILPHALLNYLVRLGWSHGDQELFTLDEMVQYFDLTHINRAAASFNYDKLFWINQFYQKTQDKVYIAAILQEQFMQRKIDTTNGPQLVELVPIMAERCKTIAEMCEKSKYFYQDSVEYDMEAVHKHWNPDVATYFMHLTDELQKITWEKEAIACALKVTLDTYKLKMPQLAIPLRIAVTGSTVSPSIDETLWLLGQDRVIKRLHLALNLLRSI